MKYPLLTSRSTGKAAEKEDFTNILETMRGIFRDYVLGFRLDLITGTGEYTGQTVGLNMLQKFEHPNPKLRQGPKQIESILASLRSMATEPAAVEREREYTEKVEKKRAEAEEAEKKRTEAVEKQNAESAKEELGEITSQLDEIYGEYTHIMSTKLMKKIPLENEDGTVTDRSYEEEIKMMQAVNVLEGSPSIEDLRRFIHQLDIYIKNSNKIYEYLTEINTRIGTLAKKYNDIMSKIYSSQPKYEKYIRDIFSIIRKYVGYSSKMSSERYNIEKNLNDIDYLIMMLPLFHSTTVNKLNFSEMMSSSSTVGVKKTAANRAVASKVENEPGTSGRARAKRGAPKWVKEMRERQATRNAKAAGTTGGGLKRNFTRKPRRHRESRPLR
jgi:regulator of replication initiation timing